MNEAAYLAQIDALLARGDMFGVAKVARQAVDRGHRSSFLLNILAWEREEAGDFEAARAILDEALSIDPHDPLLHLTIGAILRKEGRHDEAIAQFTSLIPVAGDNPSLWLERAYAYDFSGALDPAAVDYAHVVSMDPGMAPAFAGLASVLSRLGRRDEARQNAARALQLDSAQPTAHLAIARVDVEENQGASARQRLEALVKSPNVGADDRILALGLLGDACDKAGDAEAAFDAYSRMNLAFAERHQHRFVQTLQSQFIDQLRVALSGVQIKAAVPAQGPARVHAFLLGYPRSGTTLVENILASAAGVEALEERPTLRAADLAYLNDPLRIDQLAIANADEVESMRASYWDQVRTFGVDPVGKAFIDMDPLKGIKLPLIARLFPEARILVMRRDPRDVVWSCFRTNFAPSAAAREFVTLEGTARHYDVLMTFMEQCFDTFPLSVHEVRYDDLISDFDATTKAMCAFLDVEWSEDMRAFDKTAQRRGVATASQGQVRKGLYDGRGQWERYAHWMEPALPILEPWVRKFGFA